MPIHTSMMSVLEPESKKPYPNIMENKDALESIKKIIEFATVVSDNVNQDELLAHFGMKVDHRPDASTIKT